MKPTPEQVARYTAELHTKHDHIPGIAARIAKAAALVLAGDVRHDRHGYLVLSSRNDGAGYRLNDHGVCSCPDYANGAPMVNHSKFCKHRLAYNMHHRALVEALAPRIVTYSYGNRRLQRTYPNTYLLLLPPSRGSATTLVSEIHGLLAKARWNTPLAAWQPATTADKHTVERWLDHAEPIPTPGQSLAAVHIEDEIAAIVDRADTMARDAEVMPFPTWAAIHGHNLAR